MIRELFVNEHPRFLFHQFGVIHNIFSLIPVIAVIFIYYFRNKIAEIPKDRTWKILKITATILLINMIKS